MEDHILECKEGTACCPVLHNITAAKQVLKDDNAVDSTQFYDIVEVDESDISC
jgi:hypothetical protein